MPCLISPFWFSGLSNPSVILPLVCLNTPIYLFLTFLWSLIILLIVDNGWFLDGQCSRLWDVHQDRTHHRVECQCICLCIVHGFTELPKEMYSMKSSAFAHHFTGLQPGKLDRSFTQGPLRTTQLIKCQTTHDYDEPPLH